MLNVGATQVQANESIADALRRAEIILETNRDKRREAEALALRMADSMPMEQSMPALQELARRGPASAAAPLNLIPVGEVLAGSTANCSSRPRLSAAARASASRARSASPRSRASGSTATAWPTARSSGRSLAESL